MEQSQFISKVTRLLRKHGEPLTRTKYSVQFAGYADHAHEINPAVNLSYVHTLGRIAVHKLDLEHIRVTTELSMLSEAAGKMPLQGTGGQLLGSFDITALEKTQGLDLLWLQCDIHTSGKSVWIKTILNLDDLRESETERETLEYFKDFDRQIFAEVEERVGDFNDILSPQDLDALSSHLDRTIGTMPITHE